MAGLSSQLDHFLHARLHSHKENWLEKSLIKAEELSGLPREHLTARVMIFTIVYLLFGGILLTASNVIGVVYPAFKSLQAIRSQRFDQHMVSLWVLYWIIFGFFTVLDTTPATSLPFYYAAKASALLYLYLPSTFGIITVEKILEPLFAFVDSYLSSEVVVADVRN
ncbi:unnamed protein product [Caenorhabditis auriculariae]|uniref:Receptor expression-enhancing protein n=1 Tax=Caenorhabditis auriculariae TaxID=2777116 RepID=A0A8S1GY58_9PELO|nr:unnamed protein product [Caenorhabditis auriculariae]